MVSLLPSTNKMESNFDELKVITMDDHGSSSGNRTNGRFNRRRVTLLLILGAIGVFSAMTVSVQAPFYPAEAEGKGATALEYGIVFGTFEFVVFLMCPIFGKYMNRLGPKMIYNVSTLVNSIAVICFGLIGRINDHTWFITLSIICRIFEGIGCAGSITTTFVLVAIEFPESVATTFAWLETLIGIGFLIGPTIGASLYSVGGFPFPFFVIGAGFFVIGFSAVLVMPKVDKAFHADGTEERGYGIWTVIKIPAVALAALSIASTSLSEAFVSSMLEPHIRQFGLTPLQVGVVFIVSASFYAVTAPIWGYICDKISRPVYIIILGNFFIFVSFVLIGPADFVPFDTTLWMVIVGLAVQGLGFGCSFSFVSTFIVGLQDCISHGLPDNMTTYAVVAGLFQSMTSLGAWIGPSVGGYLYDKVGFRKASWLGLAVSFTVGMSVVIHTIFNGPSPPSPTKLKECENEPLLASQNEGNGLKAESTQKSSKLGSSTLLTSYGSTD